MASEYSASKQQSTEPSLKGAIEPMPNRATENFSSSAPISSEDPGLGKLSRLPGEIRNMIWREFLPKNHDEVWGVQRTDLKITKLAVLRISSRIYGEVGSYIYPRGRKPFIISVTPACKYGSWVTLSNGKKNATTWKLGSLKEASERGFLNMGRKPATFRVEIEAPDRNDGFQFVRLFWKVLNVADMLRHCVKCPRRVELAFKNGERGKWFIDGKETTTSLRAIIRDNESCWPDYKTMLLPFLQLRDIKHSDVIVPEDVNTEHEAFKMIRDFKEIIKKTTPFDVGVEHKERSDLFISRNLKDVLDRCQKFVFRFDSLTAVTLDLELFIYLHDHKEEYIRRELRSSYIPGEERYLRLAPEDDAATRRWKAGRDDRVKRCIQKVLASFRYIDRRYEEYSDYEY